MARIEEQEVKIEIIPYDTPWEVACMLINARHTKNGYTEPFFAVDDLRRVGEHLINFCNTEGGEPQ
jgi:hypothetical protein